jgi:protein gp37
MAKSKIEWTEATWNPVTGCTKVSPGCKHCYAERMSARLQNMGLAKYYRGFEVCLHPSLLQVPRTWKLPRRIFVNSMSDLFHEQVPLYFLQQAFAAMSDASWHVFQVLTKRSERLVELDGSLSWPKNVWMGVSVETNAYLYRIDHLRHTHAMTKFVSLEPLLGALPDLQLDGIDWVIVGGESGPRARPIEEAWVLDVRDRCVAAGVPFFFKQWGGVNKKRTGHELQGQVWQQMPKVPIAVCDAIS